MLYFYNFNFLSLSIEALNYLVFLALVFLLAVTAVDLKQTVQVDKDLQIRAYYAGHVRFLDFLSHACVCLEPYEPFEHLEKNRLLKAYGR